MRRRSFRFVLAIIAGLLSTFNPAHSISVEQNRLLAGEIEPALKIPVYQWRSNRGTPRAVIIAIHGLMMHGRVYDTYARKLCSKGYAVFATDMRGYGSWYASGQSSAVAYKESEADLVSLAKALKERYPRLPLFLTGESLGGSMALRLASNHPELIDGLILSAPALKHYNHLPGKVVAKAALVMASPWRKLDVSAYIQRYFSENPAVAEESIEDRLTRKSLSVGELWQTKRVVSSAARCAERVPANVPVLILQGGKDRMIKRSSLTLLQSRLRSTDQTVRWFPEKGHLLLETSKVENATIAAIAEWLDQRTAGVAGGLATEQPASDRM